MEIYLNPNYAEPIKLKFILLYRLLLLFFGGGGMNLKWIFTVLSTTNKIFAV